MRSIPYTTRVLDDTRAAAHGVSLRAMNTTATPLGLTRRFNGSFDAAITSITDALKSQGFGVLSDIDVSATLKAKLGVDFSPYRILGACNPHLAHRALSTEPAIGLLLPCNVVVRELSADEIEVSIANPEAIFAGAPDGAKTELADLPADARAKLAAALDAMS